MLGSAVCEADAHRCLCEVSIRREQDGTGCGLSDENIHIRSHSACDLPELIRKAGRAVCF